MTAGADKSARAPHGEARLAGFVYAIVVAAGMFALAYAPARIFAGATGPEIAQNVAAHETLLRLAIAAEIVCYVAFLVLAVALYRLLEGSGRFAALLMSALAISSVPFGFANITHLFEILRAVDAPEAAQTSILAAYDRYKSGLFVQSIPWGLWLVPFGYLVIRSSFLPWLLGALLILGGIGYVSHFFGRLLFENYDSSGLASILTAPRIAEVLICLWLLVLGARRTLLPAR